MCVLLHASIRVCQCISMSREHMEPRCGDHAVFDAAVYPAPQIKLTDVCIWPQQQRSSSRPLFSSLTSVSYSIPFLSTHHLLLLPNPSPILCISSLRFGAQQHLTTIAMETVAQQQVGCHCCLGAWHLTPTLCSSALTPRGGLRYLCRIHESRWKRPSESGHITTKH